MAAPGLALAAPGLVTVVTDNCRGDAIGGCQNICDLAQLAQNILNDAIYIAVFLAAFLFAWAGWLYLTNSAGNSISRAKEIFANVAIGLVIILAGWLVVDVLMRTLVGADILPWNKLCELFVHGIGLA